MPFISSLYRYNRAEGSFVGSGAAFILNPTWKLQSTGGYALGRDQGQLSLTLARVPSDVGLALRLQWNETVDSGSQFPGSSGAMNTLTGLFADQDYSDPYFRSSAKLSYGWTLGSPSSTLRLSGLWERDRSAENVVTHGSIGTGTHRPVLRINDGTDWALEATYSSAGKGLKTLATARIGTFGNQGYGSLWWRSSFERHFSTLGASVEGRLSLGLSSEETPVQSLHLLGGRHTLPGYAYRSYVGNQLLFLRIEGARPVLAPWLTIRAFAATGATRLSRDTLPEGWPVRGTGGFKGSIGTGIGLGWDLLHVDVGRGLGKSGRWEFLLSVQRRFWEWL